MSKTKKEKCKTFSRFDRKIIDRIDGMQSDADFSPYEATKKRTVTTEQLFGDEIYNDLENEDAENEEESSGAGIVIIVLILVIAIVCIGGFFLYKAIS